VALIVKITPFMRVWRKSQATSGGSKTQSRII
jgi:hypothetical protein